MALSRRTCSECGNEFDVTDREAAGDAICPACGSAEVQDTKLDIEAKQAPKDSCTPTG